MILQDIYDILVVGKSKTVVSPVEKGKPFERMGHKALEPKSRRTYGCQLPKGYKDFEAHSSMEE